MEDMTPRVAALLKRRLSPPLVPATFFGMVLGLGGLGNGWRAAARVWNVPDLVGEVLSLSAAAVWLAWLVLYGLKWITSREEAVAEFRHPIQAFFIALVPVATLIAGIAVAPYLPIAAWVMFVLGVASQVLFSAWAMGELWQGGRHTEATTATDQTEVLERGERNGKEVAAVAIYDSGDRSIVIAWPSKVVGWLRAGIFPDAKRIRALYQDPPQPMP